MSVCVLIEPRPLAQVPCTSGIPLHEPPYRRIVVAGAKVVEVAVQLRVPLFAGVEPAVGAAARLTW